MKFLFCFLWVAVALLACGPSDDEKRQQAAADSLAAAQRVATQTNRVLGVARIEPEDGLTDLNAGASGQILERLVAENDSVAKGQPLLTLDVAVERAQLSQARSKLAGQRASIEASQATLDAQRSTLAKLRDTYERNVKLLAVKAATQNQVDDSRADVDKAERDLAAAEAQLAQARSQLNSLQADIRYSQTVLGQKRVLAPQAGRILDWSVDVGDDVTPSTAIAEFAPAGPLVARTEVDELYADRVQVGQPAVLLSQSTGDTLARGTVSFAADYLKKKSLFNDANASDEDRRVREVKVRIASGTNPPLIGSRVDCLIQLK
jgi:multidrug efflux pump subunit AcrA (membrane-fusion protein)